MKKQIQINGTQLSIKYWNSSNPVANVLVVHGYGEHQGYYTDFAQNLKQSNINVVAFDQRGFGESGGARAYFFNLMEKDLIEVLEQMPKNQSIPCFIVSFSMGTIVSLAALIKKKQVNIEGIVFIGTPLNADTTIPAPAFAILKMLSTIFPKARLIPGLKPEQYSTDEEVVKKYIDDKLTIKGKWHLKFGIELMQMIKSVKKNLSSIHIPVLVLYGTKDEMVPQSGSQLLFEKITSSDKKILPFENMYHSLLTDKNKELVFTTIKDWIEKRIS